MAVTKRLRFEILRRDNHACRYCGGVAPEAILTIDHVVPVALGGSDDPGNLVTACKDCNSGKSATPPGAALVDDVGADAIRWATALRAAFDQKLEQREVRNAYLDEFEDAWNAWTYGGAMKKTVPLPSDWERSVEKWYALGLPIDILKDAVRGAMSKRNLKGYDPEFRYMAGIVWSTITELETQVAATLAAPDQQASSVHCNPDDCLIHHHETRWSCDRCGRQNCQWFCGYTLGDQDGWIRMANGSAYERYIHRELGRVCDFAGRGDFE